MSELAKVRGYWLLLGALLITLFPAVSAAGQERYSCPGRSLEYRLGSFEHNGKVIRVELFQPRIEGRFPVIVLIHGSGGLLTRHGKKMPRDENFGEIQVACAGYIALLVHYFDVSGIQSTLDPQYMEEHAKLWLDTLRQAVDYACSLPKADPAHIGLWGESLGGYLALSLALHDRRIRAVSEYAGGIRLHDDDDPGNLPPVLILHGKDDRIVPVSEALRLQKVLADHHVPYTINLYQGLNHYPASTARTEIEQTVIQFFNVRLKRR